ncbi:hypothetical protein C5E16_09990 [Clavibacter michiganensis]|uniref:Uncharacterized protein n=1 Tax=Clavibacter michiganensis TaxID=28447 RepID=A0A2S5VSN7_9MICO|nr:hypothetical protein [Clavibacter michiganensis]PPF67015.1 hypothetical protein C5E16_09990 [Clavibacter michiganensis]
MSPRAEPGVRSASRLPAWLVILVGVGSAIVTWGRVPGDARATVWAEDGGRFLPARAQDGFWSTLFAPYDGYLHLWARGIVGAASTWFPLDLFAPVVVALCSLAVGGVAVLVLVCSSSVTTWLPARIALAAVTVLLPVAPVEVLGNAANLHWYLLWGSFWIVLHSPRTWRSSIGLAVVGLTFALTEILTLLLAPLVFWRFLHARSWPVRAAYAIGLMAQAATTLADTRVFRDPASIASDAIGYVAVVGTSIYLPTDAMLGALVSRTGWWIGLVLLLPFAASAVYAFVRGRAVVRVAVVGLVGLSLAVWGISFGLNMGFPDYDYAVFAPEQWLGVYVLRYAALSSLCLTALPVLAAVTLHDRGAARREALARDAVQDDVAPVAPVDPATRGETVVIAPARRTREGAPLAILVLLVGLLAVNLTPGDTRRTDQPSWRAGVEAARSECAAEPAPREAVVPIAPAQWGWSSTLPCSFLVGR